MDLFLYFTARGVAALLQALPLVWVAYLGRWGGTLVFWLDARHRNVALRNLTQCFHAEKSPEQIRALARENFCRIGENYCCAIKTAAMNAAELQQVLDVQGLEPFAHLRASNPTENCVFATGHFGNFELFGRLSDYAKGWRCAATYRGLRQPRLDRFLLSLRTVSGSLLFERRTGGEAMKKAMHQGGLFLILISDQSARSDGLELPFFGHNCFTTRAPAVMAVRYHCKLYVPICYRTGPGRWRIEVGGPLATHENGQRRSTEAITRDINAAFETAIRRDPANWFWVHNRWKTR